MPFQPSCPQIWQFLYSQTEQAWPVSKEEQSCASCSVSLSPAMPFRREAELYLKVPPFVLPVGTYHTIFFLPPNINFSKNNFFSFSTDDWEENLTFRNLHSLNSRIIWKMKSNTQRKVENLPSHLASGCRKNSAPLWPKRFQIKPNTGHCLSLSRNQFPL